MRCQMIYCLKLCSCSLLRYELQLEFCKAYLNEHHKSDVLVPLTRAFSELGTKMQKKNAWVGGSYFIEDAEVTDITSDSIHIEATIKERSGSSKECSTTRRR